MGAYPGGPGTWERVQCCRCSVPLCFLLPWEVIHMEKALLKPQQPCARQHLLAPFATISAPQSAICSKDHGFADQRAGLVGVGGTLGLGAFVKGQGSLGLDPSSLWLGPTCCSPALAKQKGIQSWSRRKAGDRFTDTEPCLCTTQCVQWEDHF